MEMANNLNFMKLRVADLCKSINPSVIQGSRLIRETAFRLIKIDR